MPGKPEARVTDNVSHPAPPMLGPGSGNPNLFIPYLPACRMGDTILEVVVGTPDKIAKGETTVLIGG